MAKGVVYDTVTHSDGDTTNYYLKILVGPNLAIDLREFSVPRHLYEKMKNITDKVVFVNFGNNFYFEDNSFEFYDFSADSVPDLPLERLDFKYHLAMENRFNQTAMQGLKSNNLAKNFIIYWVITRLSSLKSGDVSKSVAR